MNWHAAVFKLLALVVAYNYFAFRVELFDDEYTANHPVHANSNSITTPGTNWETFDKDNAPKALSISAEVQIVLLGFVQQPLTILPQDSAPYQPVRDKSPPINFFS